MKKELVNTFASIEEYQEAKRKLAIYEDARLAWCIADGQNPKKGTSMPVEVAKTLPYGGEIDNELRSKIEVWQFINDAPKEYFLYINEEKRTATTWTGDYLGTVIFGDTYNGGFGWHSKRQSITVNAINGKRYHGTYYKSSGNYARIKQYKNQ
jgi:hypothetical protein